MTVLGPFPHKNILKTMCYGCKHLMNTILPQLYTFPPTQSGYASCFLQEASYFCGLLEVWL